MANTLKLMILTPSKIEVDEEVQQVFTETVNGKVEFLANHAPIILSTKDCIIEYTNISGERKKLFTSSGVINLKNNELVLCCDAAETSEEIDLNRAEEAKERAEKRLSDKTKVDVARAEAALARAMTRIKFKNGNF